MAQNPRTHYHVEIYHIILRGNCGVDIFSEPCSVSTGPFSKLDLKGERR